MKPVGIVMIGAVLCTLIVTTNNRLLDFGGGADDPTAQSAQDGHNGIIGLDIEKIGQGHGHITVFQRNRNRALFLKKLKRQLFNKLRIQLLR